ncbi:MAG: flagellar biosynthetic protein FliR [Phycisphaerales bacterium]|nr:flagellar biosynthetic protein FliR [Phycisphaerales bacterium]
MPDFTPILAHTIPFMLVLTRVTGIFLFTPLLTSGSIPQSFKALLAFSFAVAIYPFVPVSSISADFTLAQMLPMMFSELFIGVIMGVIMGIPMMAIQMGGYMMGYQMGLSLAESFNPELDTNSSVIGQLLFYLSIFIYIGIGGFELIFVTIADSFTTIGSGTFTAADTPLVLLLSVINSGFELAIRVASPILGVISMLLIAMGFIMKTMPQINIMSIGFSIQILTGLTILMLLIGIIATVAGDEVVEVLRLLNEWVWSFAGDAHG